MAEHAPKHDEALAEATRRGYEPRDAAKHVGWIAGGGLVLLVVGSLWVMSLFSQWLSPDHAPTAKQTAPTPRVSDEIRLRQIRVEQQQAQQAALTQYQWVDREAKVAQIPIARAMELLSANPALLASQSGPPETGDSSEEGTENE